MRQIIAIIAAFLVIFTTYSQENESNTIYVYRNDGIFNAFFTSEVDSITHSRIDLHGIKHDIVVVQEIWTQDSLYRIPLNVIDSISFSKAETLYSNNVIRLNETYTPYIISSDSLSITFDSNLPVNLVPCKGDILLFEGFNEIFTDGFAGRVSSINEKNIVSCDSVEFEDIYENLILFGDYIISEDKSTKAGYRLLPQRIAGEVPISITLPIKWELGHLTLAGEVSQIIKLRIVGRLCAGHKPYVEIQLKDEEIGTIDATLKAASPNFKQVGEKIFGISVPIPECPALKFEFATSPFVKTELNAETSFGYEWRSNGITSYVYDGDDWSNRQIARESSQSISSHTGFNGSMWFGIVESVHLATIKNFLSIGADFYIGPKISGNVDLNVADGISSLSMYELLKDTKVDLSLRFESEVSAKWRLGKANSGYKPLFKIIPGLEWFISERYLFPEFSKPTYYLSGSNVNVSTNVSRNLLFPCSIGIRLSSYGETLDSYYHNKTYWNDDDLNDALSANFSKLQYKGKYKVNPIIKFLGWEINANPENEFTCGIYVYTGGVTAGYTSASCWGGATVEYDSSIPNYSLIDECGFLYNQIGNPQNGNALKQICQIDNDGLFKSNLSNLSEESVYYYTAYVIVDGNYYYGDTKSFKTNKKDDPTPPNIEYSPKVTTGGHWNETINSATVDFIYENIPQGAICGYYLRGQKNGTFLASISKHFGYVEGKKIINLFDLEPDCTYYYQGYVFFDGKEYLGDERSFKTLSPEAQTGDYGNVTSNSATISCGYYNIPKDAVTGVRLSYKGTTVDTPYQYGEGMHSIDISNLLPATQYTYSAYVLYDGKFYEGTKRQFTTLTPSAYVGQATDITESSAKISYGFNQVPDNATCYVVIQPQGGQEYSFAVPNIAQDIFSFSNLQPNTTYSYWSYIDYYGEKWLSNNNSFTTDSPKIYGTWKCIGYSSEPDNAYLTKLVISEGGTLTQTYYYQHSGATKSYAHPYSYNHPQLIIYKNEIGDVQEWTVSELSVDNLTITATDGFSYYFERE